MAKTQAEYGATYRAKHREALRISALERFKALTPSQREVYAQRQHSWYLRNRHHISDYQSQRVAKLKLDTLTHYGKAGLLLCCWEGCTCDDIDMLTLDHIENNGAEHRKAGFPKGSQGFARLKNAGYPEGYQTLCWNHQWKKEIARLRQCRHEGKSPYGITR
jgi:hypothetical protein